VKNRLKIKYYSRKTKTLKISANTNDIINLFLERKFKISDGYVVANTKFDVIPLCEKNKNGRHVYIDSLIMSTSIDSIIIRDSSNNFLLNHEKKHEQIYKEYGNKQWKVSTTMLPHQTTDCEIRLDKIWNSFEKKYRLMLLKQNEWDSKDSNNVSHERIDVDSAIREQRTIFNATYFCRMVSE
jgi:hypothetical protein